MSIDNVNFAIDNKTFRTLFDRNQLRLGSLVYVRFSAGEPIEVFNKPSDGTVPYAVKWIAPSEWHVELTRGFELGPDFGRRIQNEIGEHISRIEIDTALERFAGRIRMEHFYKTNEVSSNPLTLVHTVLERLDLCSRLSKPDVKEALFAQHRPLVSYLYLTCFDRLGQPADWEDFGSWLDSASREVERETALSAIPSENGPTSAARALYRRYNTLYGVRSSFFRFLHEVLEPNTRRELLDSVEIHSLKNPPDLEDLPPPTDEEKERYLFRKRNDYTHKADYRPSAGPPLLRVYLEPIQEFHADRWTSTSTRGWPEILEKVVRIGLACYLRRANSEKQRADLSLSKEQST